MDWYQKKIPIVTSLILHFFGGVFLAKRRVGGVRKMEWKMIFFVSNSKVYFDGNSKPMGFLRA